MMDFESIKEQSQYAYDETQRLRRRMDTQEKTLPGQYLKGRIRTDRATPSASTDVQTPDQLGDIVRTGAYEYIVVNDSGTLKWARIALNVAW